MHESPLPMDDSAAKPDEEAVLLEATFSKKVETYWLLSIAIAMVFTCVGIVGLPLLAIFGPSLASRFRKAMSARLTERTLKVSRGILTRVEKTIPLDKITDLGMVQGPIMRAMDLRALSIETAGSTGQGALVRLIGVEDTEAFRDAVLRQRDRLADDGSAGTRAVASHASDVRPESATDQPVLREIRDTLGRIETLLKDQPHND